MKAATAGTWMPSPNPSRLQVERTPLLCERETDARHGDGGAAQHCGAYTERECPGCFAAFHSLLPLATTIEEPISKWGERAEYAKARSEPRDST